MHDAPRAASVDRLSDRWCAPSAHSRSSWRPSAASVAQGYGSRTLGAWASRRATRKRVSAFECHPSQGQNARGPMLRNKSHLGHNSALILMADHGYTAVSISARVIDKAFVYCKNLRCRG